MNQYLLDKADNMSVNEVAHMLWRYERLLEENNELKKQVEDFKSYFKEDDE